MLGTACVLALSGEGCSNSSGDALEGGAASPDGRFIAVPVERDGGHRLVVVDATGVRPARDLTDEPGDEDEPLWSPDSGRVLFLRTRPDGGHELRVATVGQPRSHVIAVAEEVDATWSPDSRWIAVVLPSRDPTRSGRGGRLTVIAAAGGHRRNLASQRPASGPRWSPDGRTILFFSAYAEPDELHDQPGDLYVVSWRSGAVRRLTSSRDVGLFSHSWTASARSVTYVRQRKNEWGSDDTVLRLDVRSGARDVLLPEHRTRPFSGPPVPAPQEPRVAVEGDGLYVAGATTTPARSLHRRSVGGPLAWSPDGALIAHDTTHGAIEPVDADVLVVDPRHRRVVNATRTPSRDETFLGWIVGRRLAVLRDDGTLWSISVDGRSSKQLETTVDTDK